MLNQVKPFWMRRSWRHDAPSRIIGKMLLDGDHCLTTGGRNFEQDKKMIEDAGFEIGHLVNA